MHLVSAIAGKNFFCGDQILPIYGRLIESGFLKRLCIHYAVKQIGSYKSKGFRKMVGKSALYIHSPGYSCRGDNNVLEVITYDFKGSCA